MMTKTNYTNGYMLTRAGTAMLILGVLLMGCNKDPQQQNQHVSAEQAAGQVPSEEKPDRDWSQPYQIMPIGDALIKIPRGYLSRRDYGDGNSKGLNEHMKLETNIMLTPKGKPKFLTRDEARKFYDDRKGEARYVSPFDTYNTVYIDVYKREIDFKKGTSTFDEESAMYHELQLGVVDKSTAPDVLVELGLKAYRVHGLKENGEIIKFEAINIIYFPLDVNFKKPNGEIFYMDCDQFPVGPQAVKSCRVSFIPRDRVAVSYSFPPQHLRHWKEIHQFVLNTLQFTN